MLKNFWIFIFFYIPGLISGSIDSCPYGIQSEVITSDTVFDLSEYLGSDPNTLILFDMGDTLVEDKADIPMEAKEAVKKINQLDIKEFHIKDFLKEPVEAEALDYIRKLSDKYKVLALTRNDGRDCYYRQFQASYVLNIDFSKAYPQIPFYHINKTMPATYDRGVICLGKNDGEGNKGQVLIEFLNSNRLNPTKVIFVDNNLQNVKDVQDALRSKCIPYVGVYYTRYENKKLKGFENSKIHEINSLEEVKKYVNQDTLLLFDIHHTLVCPSKSNQFEKYFFAKVAGNSPSNICSIQDCLDVKPVDKKESEIIENLTDKVGPENIFALTASTPDETHVLDQLKEVGVSFKNTHYKDVCINENKFGHCTALFKDGVIFAGEMKGDALKGFIKKFGKKPKRVVFVDDRRHYLQNVAYGLADSNINYIGLHLVGSCA